MAFVNEHLEIIASAVIFAAFLFFLIPFIFKIIGIKKDVRQIAKYFNELEQKANGKIPVMQKLFHSNFNEINKRFLSSRSLKHFWQEFSDHLIEDDISIDNQPTKIFKNSIQPGWGFFETDRVMDKIDIRVVDSVPGLLLGLGIAGTFLGLVISLNDFGSLSAESFSDQLSDGKLFKGAGAAFTSSLVGVVASMLYSTFEKWKIGSINKCLFKIESSLEKCVKLVTQEEMLHQLYRLDEERNKKLNNMVNDLATAMSNTFNSSVSDPINKSMSNITEAIADLKTTQQNFSGNLIEKLSGQMSGGVESIIKENKQRVSSEIDNLNISLKQVSDIQNSIENVTQTLANSLSNMPSVADEIKDMLKITNETTAKNNEIVNKYEGLLKDINDTVNSIGVASEKFDQTGKNIHDVGAEFKEACSQLSMVRNEFDKTVASLKENNNEVKNIWNDYQNRFKDVDQDLQSAYKQLAENVNDLNQKSLEHINKFNMEFRRSVEQLASAVEELSDSYPPQDKKTVS